MDLFVCTNRPALLCDLNALPDRPLEKRVEITGATNERMEVKLVPNYADNPLVCGPRYLHEDFRCSWATHLGLFSSGVLLLGINDGTKLTYKINTARPTRAFKVHGQLGKATDTYFWNGKTVERATYGHVTREKIDRVVAHMQAAHQKTMFELSGLHMDSQTAYEMASQGPIRPANNKLPVIYGIKCVYYEPPKFTLEIQSVNEYDKYLWTLVHDLGVQLKTAAHCVGVQCIRQGKFDLSYALLRKHWQLEHIVENIHKCQQLLEDNEQLLTPTYAKLTA
ncbi:mitochondrial mRNA pseudouridine synthase TRUB2 isoform X2 [Hyposmocoma kahamanoa]|uniref:mitochondrial mRNA pseudouridine synthase TRUB2 isoform X2 n=1 Tax=Hyposmocoma kahamanoa TaxID=1477025 RepID=UPI000E6D9AEA|nr:mitochondrial mRNA pseudouridine synthase TRUB2 isoform X2 [Hyposmocoma kahamanoa]